MKKDRKETPNKEEKTEEIQESQDKIQEESKIEELIDTLKRLQAEFENYKKRTDKEKEEFIKYSNANLILKLLSVLDTFEQALKHKDAETEKARKGIELIHKQLFTLLESEGLRPICSEGQKFDPFKHEVLMSEEADKEEGTVLQELQKGYMLKDKVLRHSKVKICKHKDCKC